MRMPSALRATAFWAVTMALLTAGSTAQEPVLTWSFDEDAGSWQSMDPAGHVLVTTDANVIRSEETGGVLEHAYTPAIGAISAMISPIETGLAGGQSLRCWVKTTDYAMVATALAESDGSRYLASFASLPDQWQEVVLNLDEFVLTGDTEDENGRLDPEQVNALMLGDLISFLAEAAQSIPFIVAPDLEPRMMWVDEFSVVSDSVPPRWAETDVAGIRAVRVDGFESWPLHWFSLAGKGVAIAYDGERKAEGSLSLRLTYDLPAGKAFGALTPLRGLPLTGMENLSLAVMSEMPILLLVELKEADESKYRTMVQMEARDEFETLQVSLNDLAVGDDSSDENGRLDMDQVVEMTVADVSAMAQMPVTANTLWIDDVVFTE